MPQKRAQSKGIGMVLGLAIIQIHESREMVCWAGSCQERACVVGLYWEFLDSRFLKILLKFNLLLKVLPLSRSQLK